MKTYRCESATPLQKPNCALYELVEIFQFMIYSDAQSLERSSGWVNMVSSAMSSGTHYQLGQFVRRLNWFAAISALNYPASDLSRASFFAVLINDSGDLFLRQPCQQFRGCLFVRVRVHPHIERRVKAKTEASLFRVELQR
jgi:hypothetical protein